MTPVSDVLVIHWLLLLAYSSQTQPEWASQHFIIRVRSRFTQDWVIFSRPCGTGLLGTYTQHCVLGYLQPSLRDWSGMAEGWFVITTCCPSPPIEKPIWTSLIHNRPRGISPLTE
jgi:hypothetical protein